ncbi:hypothetical protein SADUNF_Sadunf10G0001000 [Salix dunnii]|uniref:Uncharacterized protein n=1 Tax=Salix dunnii TaxID=1413687 RepID=A0A835JRJ5_9ROSI|nr:hypothetical protein SADUNF_Sadunf10G0001000 [Salix dunnii]
METRHKLKLSLLALLMLLPSTKSSTKPDSRMLYQIACTMCSTCCDWKLLGAWMDTVNRTSIYVTINQVMVRGSVRADDEN